MKKFITIFLFFAFATPAFALEPVLATVFHPFTGEQRVVEVGDPTAFDAGFKLQTPIYNFDSVVNNWVLQMTMGDYSFTDEELELIPEEAWKEVTPKILRVLPRPEEGKLGAGEYEQIVCRGDECDAYEPASENLLGFSVITRYKTTTSGSMTSTQTSVPVSSMTTFDGTTITMSLLGNEAYISLEPGSSREEIVECTGISSLSWTPCTRGLAFSGTSTSTVAANRKTHNSGSIVIMSNVHYVFERLVDKESTENIDGVKTFLQYPEKGGSDNATTSRQLITLGQAQLLANQGAATSTDALAGISRRSTKEQARTGTDLGVNDPLYLGANIASSSRDVATTTVIVSETDGYINQNRIDLTEAFIFASATTTTNIASTTGVRINSVNIDATPTEINQALDGISANVTDANLNILTDSSSTTLLHNHNKTFGTYSTSTPTTGGVVSITHMLGAVPTMIEIFATSNTGEALSNYSNGIATSTTAEKSVYIGSTNDTTYAMGETANIIYTTYYDGNAIALTGNLTTLNSTTIEITLSIAGGTPPHSEPLFILWKAWY